MIEKLRQWKLHHVLFWVFYFFFWVQYYTPHYKNLQDLYVVTAIYLLSHASFYYLMRKILFSSSYKKINTFYSILFYLVLCVLFGLLMYFLIYLGLSESPALFYKSNFMQTLLTFSISNFFTVGTLLILSVISNNRKQERKVEALEKERLKTELQYLKAQVNPHFLFNAINSVFVLIKVDPDMASETLIKLSNMLRAQLYEFTEDLIDITQEMDYLENYLALEKIRKGGRLKLDFEKDGPLEGFKIAPLMLIPFLENCFKHLSSYTDRPNIVNVKIKKIDNNLEVEFYNTCEAINLFKKQPLGGIGLFNIRRRLELIYPNRYFLDIQEGSEDFRVKLKIQIEE